MTPTIDAPSLLRKPNLGEQSFEAEPVLLHDFFDRVARRQPERPAIDVPPGPDRPQRRVTTYQSLKRQSDALANYLRPSVTVPDCVVVILLPRESEHIYLAQLGVLKSGAAYACIDPAFPDDQVSTILDDAQPVAVLTDRAGLARVRRLKPDVTGALNVLDWSERPRGSNNPVVTPDWLTPESLAYIIYTSGTTGRPKGVMIEHRGIVNLVGGDLQLLAVSPADRVGQNSSSAYDSSVEEIWSAFAAGATLVVMDDTTTRLGPDLVGWLRRERVTMFSPSPTLLRTTGCEHPDKELPDLRLVQVGGEALPTDVAERWARGCCLVNDYGPTECSVTALRSRIRPGEPITIGRPLPGLQAWVLNDKLEEVTAGEAGELCLGGVGLARGYRGKPELTARKFPHHPHLGRIYRTGDLVRQETDGTYSFHGRIDAQVKVRGYRIELEAIEARLAECPGVREAACQVQGEGAHQALVAFVVPTESATPPSFDDLKIALRQVLPIYMVPSRFGILSELPKTVSGKLNRKALPLVEAEAATSNGHCLLPRCPAEEKLALAFRKTLGAKEAISVDRDFFHDLGGDSLQAARLISLLRDDPTTAALAVRDLYESRTVAELAKRIAPTIAAEADSQKQSSPQEPKPARPTGRPMLATLVQTLWLMTALLLGAPLAYLMVIDLVPALLRGLGLVPSILLTPVLYSAGLLAYTAVAVALTVFVKKVLIGRYRPLRAPIWGSFYIRNWMVQQTARLIPWSMLEGTVFLQVVLRALGARIGERVHIHRGVSLSEGGWDLLTIESDVTISQDASLRLVDLENGEIVVGSITLEAESTLDIQASVAGNTYLEERAYLTALSFLPSGGRILRSELWDGVPARFAGVAPREPALPRDQRDLSPTMYGIALMVARNVLGACEALPALALVLLAAAFLGEDAKSVTDWIAEPSLGVVGGLMTAVVVLLTVPLALIVQLIALRLMGEVKPGVIRRWSLAYIRVWLKAGLVESANFWLCGTLLWPVWLRWAGMKIGAGCEVSSILDTIPELIDIGPSSFLADGIYLGGPRVHRGTVTLAPVRLGKNTYFGNMVVIPAGQTIPDDVLLGVSTVANDKEIRSGTSWFGHPPFELPRRQIVACERDLTYNPDWFRYLNRVFWEGLRFALPLVPAALALAWFPLLALAEEAVSLPVLLLGVIPALELAMVAIPLLISLVLKWALLGRVRPAVHGLWSSWCRRWEFHYVSHDLFAAGPIAALAGTLILNWYLRAMGMRIGRQVALGSGVAHTIDHDMLTFEDGATVSCLFQAHTFEDRVLKIDKVLIQKQASVGTGAMLLYGADIGAEAYVAPHSVVMKHERLLPGNCYAGCPTRLLPPAH